MTDTKPLAFWGRVSTEDNQDPESSRAWQLTRARTLIEPHGGRIVAEFFDIDKSRSILPQRRPEASRLLAALAEPNRGFDAVVVGEPQRAFYGNQLADFARFFGGELRRITNETIQYLVPSASVSGRSLAGILVPEEQGHVAPAVVAAVLRLTVGGPRPGWGQEPLPARSRRARTGCVSQGLLAAA